MQADPLLWNPRLHTRQFSSSLQTEQLSGHLLHIPPSLKNPDWQLIQNVSFIQKEQLSPHLFSNVEL